VAEKVRAENGDEPVICHVQDDKGGQTMFTLDAGRTSVTESELVSASKKALAELGLASGTVGTISLTAATYGPDPTPYTTGPAVLLTVPSAKLSALVPAGI